MGFLTSVLVLCITCAAGAVSGAKASRQLQQVTAQTNYNPFTMTVSSGPYTILSTPITPVAPYPQNEYQCNVTGDTRYPPYATGTYPQTVIVPVGTSVQIVFANGSGGRKLRKMLQDDLVAGGPNNGLPEYITLYSSNGVPGLVVPQGPYGVPYLNFTATEAARGQTATFSGALVVGQVIGGVTQVPFYPNVNRSPYCQVNVNFKVQ